MAKRVANTLMLWLAVWLVSLLGIATLVGAIVEEEKRTDQLAPMKTNFRAGDYLFSVLPAAMSHTS